MSKAFTSEEPPDIVGPDEADPRRGLVSVHSPVARALLGRSEGDTVEVDRPGGRAELTIVAARRAQGAT